MLAAAVTDGALLPDAVDEDPTHPRRCGGKEMRAICESRGVVADESQPCLVHQRGRLKSMARGFVSHPACSELTQFVIDQRQQLIGGFRIAAFDGTEKLGRLADEAGMLAKMARIVKARPGAQ